jgi:sulfhydrogenase subunit alpha
MRININYVARVEGEGSVEFETKEGRVNDLRLNIWEPPRFFEGFMKGRRFDEVADIVARICGICPVSHMITAIRAVENAMGFTPSQEIINLRRIMALSQIMASHIVHLYVLVLPDYYRMAMITGLEKESGRLVRMKEVLNNITAVFGGRALHPVSMVVGGFTKVPSRDIAGKLIDDLEDVRKDAAETLNMVSSLDIHDFRSETEYVALSGGIGPDTSNSGIVSDSGLSAEEHEYEKYFQESQVPYSNAKRTVVKGRGSLMVGALPRLFFSMEKLHSEARKAASAVGFRPGVKNPFMNTVAQGIEIVHGVWECAELIEGLTGKDTFGEVRIKEGSGAAVTEAPRGLLYHHYQFNRRGSVEKANIVTPTAHNSLGIEEALRKLIDDNPGLPREEIVRKCEMLVRAYDPCFSCSVH